MSASRPATSSCAYTGCTSLIAVWAVIVALSNPNGTTIIVAAGAVFMVVAIATDWALEQRRHRALQIANIDAMTGLEFEQYLERLFSSQGFRVRLTQATGDLGVDLIASRGVEIIAIQAKRCSSKVSRRAVSDAVAGMQHYRCNKAMVVTNSYFTKGAVELAQSTACVLVDRSALTLWIVQYQSGRR